MRKYRPESWTVGILATLHIRGKQGEKPIENDPDQIDELCEVRAHAATLSGGISCVPAHGLSVSPRFDQFVRMHQRRQGIPDSELDTKSKWIPLTISEVLGEMRICGCYLARVGSFEALY